ncbi:Phosphatidylinositol glycan anchor biosynthesis class U protein [Choanephora cucurbitarum]|uniref:Phosphatidylinositol glycan anchor biosynthesis class U protein n=1 Tax=Choanephora cucurbitarum TaxID=101091 RepID=A0A1C7MY41_9FUNG|nr:Phosphatidylinositol glycan anchor biosynthesis class U protein [Choanephora cucurbitarum]
MLSMKDKRVVFTLALLVRLLIFSIPSLSNTLIQRVELVTPITSFKRLTEGVYLYNHNVPPYEGDVFHQPPLLLCFFSLVMMLPSVIIPLLFSSVDLLIAYALAMITQLKQTQDQQKSKLKDEAKTTPISPFTVSTLYLFNPLTILSCTAKSTLLFTNLAIVMALLSSLRNRPKTAMFWIALASYLSFYPVMLVPAFLIMLQSPRPLLFFILSVVVFLGLSFLVTQSWDFFTATYGIILFVSDLTPNIGMFWYFFIEIFDQFRSFFMVVFQFHTFIFTIPICIKLHQQPIFVVTVLCGIMAIFKSYPSAGDASLYLGLVAIHDELLKYCRYGFLVSNLFLYASVLAPIFWHLWIYAGSGNANFFYAITLVYSLGQVVLMIDLVYAALRREFDILHPETIGRQVIHK